MMFSFSLFVAKSISSWRRRSSRSSGDSERVVVHAVRLLRDVGQDERVVVVRRHEVDARGR